MTRQIKAIETRYAGCHFRSRLEARWAVFFDTLGIRWEYEPQGLYYTNRLGPWGNEHETGAPRAEFPYLPDFWLPEQEMWVEVKGSLSDAEMGRLLNIAAHLSSNGGGGCHDSGGNDLVVLGPIPAHRVPRAPVRLHMHKGDIQATPWGMLSADGGGCPEDSHVILARDYGGDFPEYLEWEGRILTSGKTAIPLVRELLLEGMPAYVDYRVADAYEAARSARFEHGESGRS